MKNDKKIITPDPGPSPIPVQEKLTYYEVDRTKIPSYCTECGHKLTESMQSLLTSRGTAFCFKCGLQFELTTVENPNF